MTNENIDKQMEDQLDQLLEEIGVDFNNIDDHILDDLDLEINLDFEE